MYRVARVPAEGERIGIDLRFGITRYEVLGGDVALPQVDGIVRSVRQGGRGSSLLRQWLGSPGGHGRRAKGGC